MSEEVFRLVITVAVLLACIAFVVQAAVAIAFYKTVRKIQQKVDRLGDKVEPLIAKIEPVVEKAGPIIDKVGPVVERVGPLLDRAMLTMERMKPAIEGAVHVIGKVEGVIAQAVPVLASAQQVVSSANTVIGDVRPHIVELSEEAVAIARTSREQVERIGDVLHEVTDRARARLEQIDQSVGNTVGQVGEVGTAVKRAVLRPVREANGFAAGISAAVSTLVHARKSSVDSVTQDEEMFI